jgi:hypothetical protein
MQLSHWEGVCEFAHMDSTVSRQRARLITLLHATGLDPTSLARAAGVSPSTLTRFLNKADHKFALRAHTMDAVEDAARRFAASAPPVGLAEALQTTEFKGPAIEWERLPEVTDALEAQLRARGMHFSGGLLTKHAQAALQAASSMTRGLDFEERCRLAVEAKADDLRRRVD